jgi:predicted nucleic acid-binding protein
MRLRVGAPDDVVAERRMAVLETLDAFDLVRVATRILRRAADPFPTALATLDAIHLATALALRDDHPALKLATHDTTLAVAARAVGLPVVGV